ncbi:hypothetical protein NDN08_006875 [Rhodosorus marinus]|uniref:Photolyase/cryptochrome alpha/beta domain-containing protein n=1 Tax=Rhodosorus marinus TaxID=101924 RepID=A0AAV8UPC5_9RHOD|nr:hypothetical protein NDN08_006875 [Rhodosorus marinus]
MITYAEKTGVLGEWRPTGFALALGVGAGPSGFRNRCRVRRNVGLVWVYRDIRIEDQAAIRAAQNEDRLAVLFVQDPLLLGSPPADLLFLNDALEALREELVSRGSNLFVRSGIAGEEVTKFASEIKADALYATRSAEHGWQRNYDMILSNFEGQVNVVDETILGDDSMPHPESHYSRWKGLKSISLGTPRPSPAPTTLPSPPDVGSMVEKLGDVTVSEYAKDVFTSTYLEEMEKADDENTNGLLSFTARELLSDPDVCLKSMTKENKDLFRTLRRPLNYGCVSMAQLSFAGAGEKARAKDWHRRMALGDTLNSKTDWKYWLWRGCLVRFRSMGALSSPDAPAILFVHGFGASSQHFVKNLTGLRGANLKLFALDLIGFGRSEKPATHYTQHLWEAQIADFVRDVVREPVYVVGNSIGGYMSMSFVADHYPSLCKGAVLVNSAGSLGESAPDEGMSQERLSRNEVVVNVSKGAIFLLQSQIRSILVKLYPTSPEEVTNELVKDIYRDSTDPGAAYVLESGRRLPSRRTLIDLFKGYTGPLLVLTGSKDPLNDASARARNIGVVYPEAQVTLLNAGHCPHDEVPEIFNEKLSSWVETMERTLASKSVAT